MEPIKETSWQIRIPDALLREGHPYSQAHEMARCVIERIEVDVELEPELARFKCVVQKPGSLKKALRDGILHYLRDGSEYTAKVSGSGDRTGSSVLHYLRIYKAGDEAVLDARSVISDAEGVTCA